MNLRALITILGLGMAIIGGIVVWLVFFGYALLYAPTPLNWMSGGMGIFFMGLAIYEVARR